MHYITFKNDSVNVEMIEPNVRCLTTVGDWKSWQIDHVKTQCCSTETDQCECTFSTPVVLKLLLIDPTEHRFIFQFWLYGWVVGSNNVSAASLLFFSCSSMECNAWLEIKVCIWDGEWFFSYGFIYGLVHKTMWL